MLFVQKNAVAIKAVKSLESICLEVTIIKALSQEVL